MNEKAAEAQEITKQEKGKSRRKKHQNPTDQPPNKKQTNHGGQEEGKHNMCGREPEAQPHKTLPISLS